MTKSQAGKLGGATPRGNTSSRRRKLRSALLSFGYDRTFTLVEFSSKADVCRLTALTYLENVILAGVGFSDFSTFKVPGRLLMSKGSSGKPYRFKRRRVE